MNEAFFSDVNEPDIALIENLDHAWQYGITALFRCYADLLQQRGYEVLSYRGGYSLYWPPICENTARRLCERRSSKAD